MTHTRVETKDEMLRTRLIIHAELARNAGRREDRDRALVRAYQTLMELGSISFNVKKLTRALERACIEHPEWIDPVVRDKREITLNGTFDVDILASEYFRAEGAEIEEGGNV